MLNAVKTLLVSNIDTLDDKLLGLGIFRAAVCCQIEFFSRFSRMGKNAQLKGFFGGIRSISLTELSLTTVEPGLLHGNLNFARQFRFFTRQF